MVMQHKGLKARAMNNVDPDDGNRWVCNACRLPIFSTPFVSSPGDDPNNNLVMHFQCADELPAKIEGHPLHPDDELRLIVVGDDNISIINSISRKTKIRCSRCRSICGTKFYACNPPWFSSFTRECHFTLDLACALSIKIAHRSHPQHRLTATRGRSCSFICNACGTQHRPPLGFKKGNVHSTWDLSYVCSSCDFWIHPDCASLPNAMVVDDKYHHHPLLLSYASHNLWDDIPSVACAICDGDEWEGNGKYECLHCGYSAHVKCVLHSDHPQPVLLRDAKFAGLLCLPMPDEHQNLMASLMKTYNDTTDSDGASTSTTGYNKQVHEHPLMFHDRDGDDIARGGRVCNACVRVVSLPDPFYSCHEPSCKDFILHHCCSHLPSKLPFNQTLSPLHYASRCRDYQYPLYLSSKPQRSDYNTFDIFNLERGALRTDQLHLCNGFVYSCSYSCGIYMDVVSALMPASITHDAHSRSHILRISNQHDGNTCTFCNMEIDVEYEIGYECNHGCDFFVHAECAILPNTVSHEFDQHPLKLMTYNPRQPHEEEEKPFCKICENDMANEGCYYGCSKCNQTFHTECFPYFDSLSKIKFGFTVQVTCHDCPLTCVRAHPLVGYKCGHCKDPITEREVIAFECTDCYFRIHRDCADELLSER